MLVNSFSGCAWLYKPIYAIRPILLARWFKAASVFWYRYWHYFFLRQSLVRRFAQGRVDVVNAQCPLSAKAALAARRLAKSDCKVVLTCHFNLSQADEFVGKGELRKESPYYHKIRALEAEILTQVDGVVFVSNFSRKTITNMHGFTRDTGTVIFNGVAKSASPNIADKAQIGLPGDAFVLVSVGTLEPRKNQYCLVTDMAPLLKTRPTWFLLLIGDGQDRGRISAFVREHELGHQVRLLGYREDVVDFLALGDIYCHPAVMENLPIAVVEAMAAGLPIVAAPVGGIPELVEHLGQGVLVECDGNSDRYVNWIKRLGQEDDFRRRLGESARSHYSEYLTLSAMVGAYRDYYRSLLDVIDG